MNKKNQTEYYHISPLENLDSILSKGLKSNNNQIFFCDNTEQLPFIANNQLGLYKYSIFKISNKGNHRQYGFRQCC